jgi:hypothetical protein
MSSTDLKALKQLAKLCRSVGIQEFKCAEFEFKLSPITSHKAPRKGRKTTLSVDPSGDLIETEMPLTEEELLFWSSNPGPAPEGGNEQ